MGMMRHGFDRRAVRIHAVEVHGSVAVGSEIYIAVVPHGKAIRAFPVGNLGELVGSQIAKPDVLSATAIVALPMSELARKTVEGDEGTIR